MKFALFLALQLLSLSTWAIDCQDLHPIKSFHPTYATFLTLIILRDLKD